MARKRKSRKTSRRRGRRMGAIKGGAMTSALGIIAGAVAAKFVVNKFMPNLDEKIKSAGVIALGLVLPNVVKGEMGKAIGNGMIATGGATLVGSFVPGLGAMDDSIEFPVTVGEIPDNLSVIAGGDDSVMAGGDEVLAGYGYADDGDEEY